VDQRTLEVGKSNSRILGASQWEVCERHLHAFSLHYYIPGCSYDITVLIRKHTAQWSTWSSTVQSTDDWCMTSQYWFESIQHTLIDLKQHCTEYRRLVYDITVLIRKQHTVIDLKQLCFLCRKNKYKSRH